jgi:hypothetical protein
MVKAIACQHLLTTCAGAYGTNNPSTEITNE